MATNISRNSRNGKQTSEQTTILENGILKCSSRCGCTMLNMPRARWCSTIYVHFHNRNAHTHESSKKIVDYTHLSLAPSTTNIRVPTSSHAIHTDSAHIGRNEKKTREIYSHKFTMNYEILACALPPLHITYLWNKLNTHAHERASERSTDG